MAKSISKCRVCGAEYEVCASCEKTASWRLLTDTIQHYAILCILMDYKENKDANSAYEALKAQNVDFANLSAYRESVSALISEIYNAVKPVVNKKSAIHKKQEQNEEIEDYEEG